ncbi:MAG: phosphopantothenoylcysteine decarboxylase [Planctomycetota bacterium]
MLTRIRFKNPLRLMAATAVVAVALGLVTLASNPYWQDVFVASFDKATNDPATWAEIGSVSTVPSRWGRSTGDSGVKSGYLVLTSDGGDASTDIGFNGLFSSAISTGVAVATWELAPQQSSATFQVLGIDKGGDIVGLTFGGDGTISVSGHPEKYPYLEDRTYLCWMVATFTAPSVVWIDIAVQDKVTGVTIASWSFGPEQSVPSIGRLSLLRGWRAWNVPGRRGQGVLAGQQSGQVSGTLMPGSARTTEHVGSLLITAGGTREPIDEVRYIGNSSTGALGCALAQEALRRGCSVSLLRGQGAIEPASHERLQVIVFTSAADLRARLQALADAGERFTAVIHAAAVADYTPDPVAGKIRSDRERLVLELKPVPKIVDELKAWFPRPSW